MCQWLWKEHSFSKCLTLAHNQRIIRFLNFSMLESVSLREGPDDAEATGPGATLCKTLMCRQYPEDSQKFRIMERLKSITIGNRKSG